MAGLLLYRAAHADTPVKIGALQGPQADLLSVAAGMANTQGLNVKVVRSDDAAWLIGAVQRGELQATASHNAVQLGSLAGSSIVPAFATITLPTGIYSRRVKSIVQLRDYDVIVLPDPKLENARARVLMYNYRLLFAHEDDGLDPGLDNIVDPRHFVLRSAETSALADHLKDAAAVLLPYEAAARAGLRPATDSIALEDGKSPYAQVVAVRAADRNAVWLANFARIFQSRGMRRHITERYGDSVQPPW